LQPAVVGLPLRHLPGPARRRPRAHAARRARLGTRARGPAAGNVGPSVPAGRRGRSDPDGVGRAHPAPVGRHHLLVRGGGGPPPSPLFLAAPHPPLPPRGGGGGAPPRPTAFTVSPTPSLDSLFAFAPGGAPGGSATGPRVTARFPAFPAGSSSPLLPESGIVSCRFPQGFRSGLAGVAPCRPIGLFR